MSLRMIHHRWLYHCAVLTFGYCANLPANPATGLNYEVLVSDDIVLTDGSAYLKISKWQCDMVLSYGHSDYWIDYRPSKNSLIGVASDRHESKDSLRFASQGSLGGDFKWFAEGGGYLGFDDYQSLWIAEYYRQYFQNYAGYESHDPKGADGLLAIRWDYLQTSGFAKASMFFGHDRISPQWEPVIGGALLATRSSIDSLGGRIEFENLLSTRVRIHNSLTVSDNSARLPRWSYESMVNCVLSDPWVLKGTMGAALENPDFHAFWATVSVEWDYQQRWFVGLGARFYQDSGEIDETFLHGVNAPAATTLGAAVTIRWMNGPNQASLGIGPYWTEYDRMTLASPVSQLFADRSWLWIQAAWSYQF